MMTATAAYQRRRPACSASILVTWALYLSCLHVGSAFVTTSLPPRAFTRTRSSAQQTALLAKKSKKSKKKEQAKTSGFGGKATEPCPCGSGLGYMKCCGKLHKDATAYADATAEQVVRARYSAYAKREIDFIIGSTHPLNKNFMTDIEHWKSTIEQNCYDNFELTSCKILNESYDEDASTATVQFVANMIQVDSRERTAFMETSTFERGGEHVRGGAWLYRDGEIEEPPGREETSKEEEVAVDSESSDTE